MSIVRLPHGETVSHGVPADPDPRGGGALQAPGGTEPQRRRLDRPWQLAVVAVLFALVFGTMAVLYVQSLSLPRCGTAHVSSPTAVPRPEEIRCRR